MIVTVFRARLKDGIDVPALEVMGARMAELAQGMPGFISHKDYVAADGEAVTVVEFESMELQEAWRRHPEHVVAQQRGQREFFSEYRIQVCELIREMKLPR
ncbi:MAG: antibiotic biosynthesis monooxygenase [Deltaproteobacteria bacterium]|nr:antibiotic biosynthesis monooxygenase [Deltaproteobacteria bacterium]